MQLVESQNSFISYKLSLVLYSATLHLRKTSKLSLIRAQWGRMSKPLCEKNSLNRGRTSWWTQNAFQQWPKFCKVTPAPLSFQVVTAKICWRRSSDSVAVDGRLYRSNNENLALESTEVKGEFCSLPRFWPWIFSQGQTSKAKVTVPKPRPAYCKAKATKFGLKAKAKA